MYISGTVYISNNTTARAAVQNQEGGTIYITGGTIISNKQAGVENNGTLVVGQKDGEVVLTNPIIQGATYGVNSTTSNFSFYDGVIKGKTSAINDETKLTDIETGHSLNHKTEVISSATYQVVNLANVYQVTFNPNGGTVSETTRNVEEYGEIGVLPSPTRADHEFDGWFTQSSGGRKINASEIITGPTTFYAQWTDVNNLETAEVNGVRYNTLLAAVQAVPTNNTQTTVTVLRDTAERITVNSNQNIIFDIGNHTLTNNGNSPVIESTGTVTIHDGNIYTTANQAAINCATGCKLYITGGTISARGPRQCLYNNGGTATISGNVYMSSTTTERACVQNLNKGVLRITGGTIISTGFNGIENAANLYLGEKDGSIDKNTPIIQGKNFGVNNSSKFYFYDGTIKGVTKSINGNITDKESNSTRIDLLEDIEGETYKITFLQ